jgi:hypothetical protein
MKALKHLLPILITVFMFTAFTTEANAVPRVKICTVVVKPAPKYVWVSGHYKINKYGKRVWVPGHWKRI